MTEKIRIGIIFGERSGDLEASLMPEHSVLSVLSLDKYQQISKYPKLWEPSGLSFPALDNHLVEVALDRKSDRGRMIRKYRGKE